ncbi:MAG: alanine racemase [Clostridia bacterium]|nr:alanine racemase [Clostridia bacterium]
MSDYLKRTWAQVDLDNITKNFHAIRSFVRPGCLVMAVVKADAYGHGVPYVARELYLAGADYFGVSNLEEAMQLRASGIYKPVLILGSTPVSHAAELIRHGITQTVCSLDYAAALSEQAARAGGRVNVHIKLDTGMGRLGFLYNLTHHGSDTIGEIEKSVRLSNLDATGIFTHFAVADEPQNSFTRVQFELFTDAIDKLRQRGVEFRLRHCCNSAGLLNFPSMQLDMVRPGIILYGLLPVAGMPVPITLRPAMELKTIISQIKTLGAGVPLSYGLKYRTEKATTVATLPVGYADGFSRRLTNNAEVLVGGRRAGIIGRVCMDQCMADITGIADVQEGGIVTIIGRDGGAEITMDELAGHMGTINYEAVCLIGKRVPRIFFKGGQNVGLINYVLPQD